MRKRKIKKVIKTKIFRSQNQLKKYFKSLPDNHYYYIQRSFKNLLGTKLQVVFYEINDIIEFIKSSLENIYKDILLIEKYEMSFLIKQKQITITLEINNSQQFAYTNEVLKSIEVLLGAYVNCKFPNDFKIILLLNRDFSNFKNKIEEYAKEVLESKLDLILSPMNRERRKTIHKIIKRYPNLISMSVGEDAKRVVIKYKKQMPNSN